MNERIPKQARHYADENYPGSFVKYDPEWFAFYNEKFAELIVKECADLFVDRRYMVLNPLEPFAYERVRVLKEHDKDTIKKIKQHFGVEP
jgi:hypothetical protein